MSELLPFIVAGLTTGAIYGLAGVGLVLTYKTSGVFNFAHGGIATASAYLFYELQVQRGMPWALAAAITILTAGLVLGVTFEALARAIQGRSLAYRVASTVGALLAIEATVHLIYGITEPRQVPQFLGDGSVTIFDTIVQTSQIITFVFAIVATAALSLFLRHSRSGLAMRAVVDDPDLLASAGTDPVRTRRLSWILGVTFASASGVLFSPLLPLDPVQLTFLVVAAFGAAALGAFSSLNTTFAGGLVIGVLASLATKWFPDGVLAGVSPALPFLVLFAVLLVFPKRRLVGEGFTLPSRRVAWTAPLRFQAANAAVLVAVLCFVPTFAGVRLTAWTTALALSIVFMSLWLLVRTSGQVSLCHVAFTAIGVCGFSHLTDQGIPWLPALIMCGLIAIPIACVLAIPAIRLSGLYLALATFGFGVLLQVMFYTQDYMFGSNGVGLTMPRPDLGFVNISGDEGFFYVVLIAAVLSAAFVIAVAEGRLGRLLRGLASSPLALQTNGVDTNVVRVLVFCASGFLAAIGGALAGVAQTTVSAEAYPPLLSLTYFVLIIIVGGGAAWGGVLAAAGLILLPAYVDGEDVAVWLQLLFGLAALAVALVPDERRQVPPHLRAAITRLSGKRKAHRTRATVPTREMARPGSLKVDGLGVRFGGLVAVDGVDIVAPTGRITGLIGPNGAGKTTTFNACSGLIRPSAGDVQFDDRSVSRTSIAARARHGLGRTFQKMELFDALSVRDNVAIGAEGAYAGANPLRHLAATPRQSAAVDAAVDEALRLCELESMADRAAADLSTGQRRLVELARCLAGPYRVLLLDEPSSGLDAEETAKFGALLKRVVQERGVGVLLVEHDMSLVLDACEHIYVLDFGKLVFDGTPSAVTESSIVRAAYLGDAEVQREVETSGA